MVYSGSASCYSDKFTGTPFMSLSQCHGYSRVLGTPIPKTLVIWASPVTLIQITKVTWEGDADTTRVLGLGMSISLWHRHFRNSIELTVAETSGTVTRKTGNYPTCSRTLPPTKKKLFFLCRGEGAATRRLTGNKHWPIADQCVPSSDPRNNCGTHFGSRSLRFRSGETQTNDLNETHD